MAFFMCAETIALVRIAQFRPSWNQLKTKAEDYGWTKLDDMIDATVQGDHSHNSELTALTSGKGAELNTSSIEVDHTTSARLPKTKAWLASLGDKGKGNTIGSAIGRAILGTFDNRPDNVVSLMRDFEMMANGKYDAAGRIKNAMEAKSAGVGWGDQFAFEYVIPGSKLDQALGTGANRFDRFKMTWGQAYNLVEPKSQAEYSGLVSRAEASGSTVLGLLNPANGFGFSPGNDITTIEQNITLAGKLLDPSNPQSLFGRMNTAYGQLGGDIQALLDSGAEIPKAEQDRLRTTFEQIQGGTTALFNQIAGYMDMATQNLASARDRAKAEQLAGALITTFSGLAAFGSIGFGLSNGSAAMRQVGAEAGAVGGGIGPGIRNFNNIGNMPALFGSGTLFMNNLNNLTISALHAGYLGGLIQSTPGFADTVETLKKGATTEQEALGKMIGSLVRLDYAVNDQQRFTDYASWAYSHKDQSSLFGNGDDSAYKGIMPYKGWETGKYRYWQPHGSQAYVALYSGLTRPDYSNISSVRRSHEQIQLVSVFCHFVVQFNLGK